MKAKPSRPAHLSLIGIGLTALTLGGREAHAAATTVNVCPDGTGSYTTIQSAVDAVGTGSTLRLCEATFEENVTISAKTLTLRSIGTAENTILDGGGAGPVVEISGGANVRLFDLSIQNGNGTSGGGGVRCESATINVDSSIVQDNTATQGGGIYANSCSVLVKYSVIAGNTSTVSGGGFGAANSSGLIRNSEFADNISAEGGGLHIWSGSLKVHLNDIHDNEATTTDTTLYGAGSGGGGIFVYGSIPIRYNTIDSNTSGYNGGGIFVYQGSADIEGNTVTYNTSAEDGGGVYTSYHSSNIFSNDISYNTALDDGGGLRAYVGGAIIQDNTFSYNSAADDGGGIKVSHSYNEILDNILTGNSATDGGGGLELDNDTSLVDGNTFTSNTAANGGAIRSKIPDGALTITNNSIQSNTATTAGGGIYIENANYGGDLSHLDLYRNKGAYGGGIYVLDSTVDLTNSVVEANASPTSGGGLYLDGASVNIANVIVFNNYSRGGSGLVFVDAAAANVYNSIVSGNDGSVAVTVSGALTPTWTYNDVYDHSSHFSGMSDPTGSDGNIEVNPRYSDASGGDFTLRAASGCVDAGDPGVLDVDGSQSDMGAYGGPNGAW